MILRTKLQLCDDAIEAAYLNSSNQYQRMSERAGGRFAPDSAAALLALHQAVAGAGGKLRITDGFRDLAEQAAAREKYLRWVAAGKPARSSPTFDDETMKAAHVNPPGRSFHGAGRAIDVDLAALQFPGVAADRQLEVLWEFAKSTGWQPIISEPRMGVAESWHFEHYGEWAPVLDVLPNPTVAMCACLDVGQGEGALTKPRERFVQAQLHRAGYDVGDVDGDLGPNTFAGLTLAGVADDAALIANVIALPSSPLKAVFRKGQRVTL